tara:strand:- start:1420 stop:2091 length:672 start_codon:yes stop_codon:yes gene_type:complete
MKFSLIEILNTNVYLTNIISIPIIILTFLIARDIRDWNRKETYTEHRFTLRHWYEFIWGIYFIIVVFGFIFSNIYHLNMFTNNTFWKWIGIIDQKVSAPLMGVIMGLLCILYFIYLLNTSIKENEYQLDLKKETIPLYAIGMFFLFIGIVSYIVKRQYYSMPYFEMATKMKTVKDYAIWTSAHIFFHYTTYTGALLIVILYYIENKDVYRTINELMFPNNTKD